ncbi:MAG: hypothetical protein FLDDKLPJ_02156 [Phycisphaerae bacterium]|nr:hypothetical protein [Phycisphaerae bacterium]
MTSSEIRRQFIEFFRERGHTVVPSSPVVPFDDPTLLFTNAGMNQFKPIFLGQKPADVDRWTGVTPGMPTRAANSQKCIRAGGKHNDLDDVGKDTYHHTFFEMLGNWSFGDYFKREAIAWAWELLTRVWSIPKERLYATYFQGDPSEGLEPDQEAADLWRTATDIDESHIVPGNKKDNFWEMGDTGPCGPCSEIHIDLTPDCSGGPLVNKGDARVMEIWNLVFIQFNRGSDGKLTPLPARHVDTGMGFERLCSVLQGLAAGKLGRFTNYDTDVFTPIFQAIRKRTGAPAYAGTLPGAANLQSEISNTQIMIDVSYRVIADHLRALTFAITDGAIPSNDGRGFVLRRILRRAVRFGRQYLNMHEPFICDLVEPLVQHMSDAFPELRTAHGGRNVAHLKEVIRDEEASFLETLDRGIALFEEEVVRMFVRLASAHQASLGGKRYLINIQTRTFHHTLPSQNADRFYVSPETRFVVHEGDVSRPTEVFLGEQISPGLFNKYCGLLPQFSGATAFRLHDTYGFPIDLTQQMAEERGLTVDIAEYERLMAEARARARDSSKEASISVFADFDPTDDQFKYSVTELRAKVLILSHETASTGDHVENCWPAGELGSLVLDRTCFYAEQGGQVGDSGTIEGDGWTFEVLNTARGGVVVDHQGVLRSGQVMLDAKRELVTARINTLRRLLIEKNHTATHLLNWALREALCSPEERVNPHVQQKGSLVDAEKTRFDFSHNKALSEEEIDRIEDYVMMQIHADHPVYAASREEDFVDQAAARQVNTLRAVFGEKYPEKVRVVSIGVPVTEADAKAAGKSDWLLKSPQNPEWMRYSVEFCGGTHVKRTGEIGDFVIVSEEAVAKGVRRVVGVTAQAAKEARARAASLRDKVAALWDAPEAEFHSRLVEAQKEFSEALIPVLDRHKIREQLDQLAEKARKLEKQKAAASGGAVMDRVAELLAQAQSNRDREGAGANAECGMRNAELNATSATGRVDSASGHSAFSIQHSAFTATINGVAVIVAEVPPCAPDALRSAIDWIRQKTDASAVLLACVGDDGKVTLLAGMSKTVVDRGIKAGDLIKEISPLVGGKGGGRPDLAQGGGTDAAGLPKALAAAAAWIQARLR